MFHIYDKVGYVSHSQGETGDWRDGHLFVGNQLALDFLNTDLLADDEVVELLPDAAALARWTRSAGLLTESEAARLSTKWATLPAAAKSLAGVRHFRDRLRTAVFALEAGYDVPAEFLDELNAILRTQPVHRVVKASAHGYAQTTPFEPRLPSDLLGPLAEATMMLLTNVRPDRVRKCEGCAIHFQDVSKKSSRRWCSMNLCGNKVKVAAYQRRKRNAS